MAAPRTPDTATERPIPGPAPVSVTRRSAPYTCTRPPGPQRHHNNRKCYAAGLADCDDVISGEHIISESVLEQLRSVLRVTDPWLGFEQKELRPANLKAKILCARHNSALSGLDTCARDVFRALRSVPAKIASGGGVDVANGYDLERWLLKVLCGFIAQHDEEVPSLWVRILFGQCDILAPTGLNLNVRIGEKITNDVGVLFETARTADGQRAGCAVTLQGFRFLLSLDGRRIFSRDEIGKQSLFRPAQIRWIHRESAKEYVLAFTWYPSAGDGITLTYEPPRDR